MMKYFRNFCFLLSCLLISCIYFYVRRDLLTDASLLGFWDSDYSIFVMMAEDIKNFRDFPIYYWGAGYLGPLNNVFMAFVSHIADFLGHKQELTWLPGEYFDISPFIAVLSTMILLFLGVLLWILSFKKYFSTQESIIAGFLMSIGGFLMIKTSARPLAPEVALFLGGLLSNYSYTLINRPSAKNLFIFGLLFGFSWWMNQIVVFVLVPIIFYLISDTSEYRSLRNSLMIKDRLMLNYDKLNLKVPPKPLHLFLKFLYFIASLNFLLGLTASALGGINTRLLGVKLKIGNGFSPIKTSLLVFIASQFLIWLFSSKENQNKVKEIFKKTRLFLIGVIIGYSPVLIIKIFKLRHPFPAPRFEFIALKDIISYYYKLATDFFPKIIIGLDNPLTTPFLVVFVISILWVAFKYIRSIKSYALLEPKKHSKFTLFWAVAYFNIIYILICERARGQYAYRYAILCLPILSIYISSFHRFFSERFKKIGLGLTLAMAITFSYGNYESGQETVKWISDDKKIDHKIEKIIDSPCDVFFSNYWNTYVFEYFTQRKKKFAVVRGQDRTPERTKMLLGSKERLCEINETIFEISPISKPPVVKTFY